MYVATCVPWHTGVEARGQHERIGFLLLPCRSQESKSIVKLDNKCLSLAQLTIYRRAICTLLSMVLGTGCKPKVRVSSVSGKGLNSTSMEPSQCISPCWKRGRQSMCPRLTEAGKALLVPS